MWKSVSPLYVPRQTGGGGVLMYVSKKERAGGNLHLGGEAGSESWRAEKASLMVFFS